MKSLAIKGERVKNGFTQKQVADKLGMSVQSYQKKESGRVRFSDKEKFKLAKILNLKIEQLNDLFFDGQLDYFF